MELLPLLCLCLLTRSGITSAQQKEPSKVIKVKEDSDVVLPCSLSTKEDIESERFDWRKVPQKDDGLKEVFLYDSGSHYNNYRRSTGQSKEFKGRVFHFQDELEHGNASIIIRNTKLSDSGVYTCDFPLLQPPQKFYIKLVVVSILKDRTDENIPGAAPKPVVTTHKTEDGVLLLCHVNGTPKPKVEWQDRAGNILPAEEHQVLEGGCFYIILTATVTETDSDYYRCVATQETISHQVSTRNPVKGSPTGLIVGSSAAVSVIVCLAKCVAQCKKARRST